ncbi:MAG: hypothetical protein ABSH39_15220 [Candidatus Acidiferrum sp.]
MRAPFRIITILVGFALIMIYGCPSKQPLTSDKAKELLEASNVFRPQFPVVNLTEAEVQKGKDFGYWALAPQAEHHRENGGMLLVTPEATHYFQGNPMVKNPVITLRTKLGGRLIEIKDIQPNPEIPNEQIVTYTYTWKFENDVPQVADLFKDHPPTEGKQGFAYGDNGWQLSQ